MRAVGPILASTISVALLAGVSSVGAAQSEDGPLFVPVTGQLTDRSVVAGIDYTTDQVGPVTEYRLFEFDWTIDWSDARLPTQLRSRQNANQYPPSNANATATRIADTAQKAAPYDHRHGFHHPDQFAP